MSQESVVIRKSNPLQGTVRLTGAKNAVLVTMASLILAPGSSRLKRVPATYDVCAMIELLRQLGAHIVFDEEKGTLEVDTSHIRGYEVPADVMHRMRASILVMGPLLARSGRVCLGLPGGCAIGKRPIDFHLKAFEQMGAHVECNNDGIEAQAENLHAMRFILDYPSVGATENIMMAAVLVPGITEIVNAALEPEVFDLIAVLRKMGAHIEYGIPATIIIHGVSKLHPIEHDVMYDRLEAGTILLAVAATGGEVNIPDAPAHSMELFLEKLRDMGNTVTVSETGHGVHLTACERPQPISFKTMPYPGFPTDLQSPTMALLCCASGISTITETVFENRFMHVPELQKMGAQITVQGNTATVTGVDELVGTTVTATDIRASAALIIAGLRAEGETIMTGTHHLRRGYEGLVEKLQELGADITWKNPNTPSCEQPGGYPLDPK